MTLLSRLFIGCENKNHNNELFVLVNSSSPVVVCIMSLLQVTFQFISLFPLDLHWITKVRFVTYTDLTVEPSGGVNGGVAVCFPFVFSPNVRTKTLSSHIYDG